MLELWWRLGKVCLKKCCKKVPEKLIIKVFIKSWGWFLRNFLTQMSRFFAECCEKMFVECFENMFWWMLRKNIVKK